VDRTSNLHYFFYGYLIFFKHTFINTIGLVNLNFSIFLFIFCLSFVCYLLIFLYFPLVFIDFTGIYTIQTHSWGPGKIKPISMYTLCIFFHDKFKVISRIAPYWWKFHNTFIEPFPAFRAKIEVAHCNPPTGGWLLTIANPWLLLPTLQAGLMLKMSTGYFLNAIASWQDKCPFSLSLSHLHL
jgi:hypothetical protein